MIRFLRIWRVWRQPSSARPASMGGRLTPTLGTGAALLFLATSFAHAEQEPWYCSGESFSASGELSPLQFLEFALVPYAVKTLCTLDTDVEATTVRAVYTSYGCSADSNVGSDIETQLAISDRQMILQGMLGMTEEPDFTSPIMQELCGVAAEIQLLPFQWDADLNDSPLTPGEQAALDAQLVLLERLFELFETMPQN